MSALLCILVLIGIHMDVLFPCAHTGTMQCIPAMHHTSNVVLALEVVQGNTSLPVGTLRSIEPTAYLRVACAVLRR
jgi:hypothetical protein